MYSPRIIKVKSLSALRRIRSIDNPTILDMSRMKETKLMFTDFPRCKVGLEKVILPTGLEYIDKRVFDNSINLVEVENAPVLKFIGDDAFINCSNLIKFPFSPSINYIGENAFQFCTSLKEVNLWDVTGIRANSFDYCTNLEKLKFHKAQVIEHHAFSFTLKLKEIYLPESVTKIGNYAFQGNFSLERLIAMPLVPPQICQETFTCCSFKEILVKKDAVEAYKNAKNWDKLAEVIRGFDDLEFINKESSSSSN